MFLCVPLGSTQYIFHTPMARYSLFVLKAVQHQQIKTNKQTLCVCVCDIQRHSFCRVHCRPASAGRVAESIRWRWVQRQDVSCYRTAASVLVLQTLCTSTLDLSTVWHSHLIGNDTNSLYLALYFTVCTQWKGPCRLRGCNNRPAVCPGWMLYKATKPGSFCRIA